MKSLHVVLRVDDRTAYFSIAKKDLLTGNSLELWNHAKQFCEVETQDGGRNDRCRAPAHSRCGG